MHEAPTRRPTPLSTRYSVLFLRCGRLALLAFGVLAGACGGSSSSEGMGLLLKRPVGGCTSLGPVKGSSAGNSWLDAESHRIYAQDELVDEAKRRSATHVLLGEPEQHGSRSRKFTTISGEAFRCDEEPRFDESPILVIKGKDGKPTKEEPPDPAVGPPAALDPLRSAPPSVWATWQGSASQPGFGSFDAQLSLSRAGAVGACGAAEYPTLGCRGTLTSCTLGADGSLEATQSLTVVGKCVDGGKIRMTPRGTTLSAAWYLPDGRVAAQGELRPPKNDHPLLESARRQLPPLPPRSTPVLDDELFEVLPQFLPDVLPAGFVTDDPATTRIGADSRFSAVRTYRQQGGAVVVVAFLLVRSEREGASATLMSLEKGGGSQSDVLGFPALWRPAAPGARQTVYVVLSPRLQIEVNATGIAPSAVEDVLRGVSPQYLAQVESRGNVALEALTQRQQFKDAQGQTVEVAAGHRAFADRVVSIEPGPNRGRNTDANGTLGPPRSGGIYSLGCRGKIRVAFEDNVLVDGPGPDLHLFEVGPRVETMHVRISEDGEKWLDAGQVKGQPASLDISKVATPGRPYRFVEVEDVGSACTASTAGADIDAIGALNGASLSEFASKRAPARAKPKSNAAPRKASPLDDPRHIAEAVQKSEGVPLDVSVKGQDYVLSEPKSGYSVRSSGTARADVNGDGKPDAVVLNSRGDARRTEHQLEVYTERDGKVGPLAQAVIGYGDPSPTAGSLRVKGNRIEFAMSGSAYSYELRHGSLIRLRP